MKIRSCDGAGLTYKKRRIEKQEEMMSKREKEQHLRYKCIAGKLPTNKAVLEEEKAMISVKESWKKLKWNRNLFDDHPYILNKPIMGKTWYESRTHAKNSLKSSMKIVFYFAILKLKKTKTNEM